MADICIVLALVGSSIALALGVAVFPRKVRELLVTTAPKPTAEAQVIALAKAEIAATKRGDLLAAARYAEKQERAA